ncbi:MAG TPA: asparagine synthase (glutamine-hydrolyzing) [Burkholderiales bacterium]
MCGVVGAFTFANSGFSITVPYLERMRDTMVHRGPDGAGVWISPDGRVGLGHRRLSIVDLSDLAAQPMANADGTLLVSFNGEIYNHAAIRKDLERTGKYRWKTDHSDTEVILHAFEEWGIECLERFRGMFAFALWDAVRRELWLVRDRIGVKPLYYSVHHGRIVFASEIKALLEDPGQARAVHPEAFYHYLSFLTTPAPQTLFDGIRKLAPGTWLRVRDNGSIQERCYWDVWDRTEPLVAASEGEIRERLLASLRESVSLRKLSDVPVGVFLSGGIDSSTNTALFSEGEAGPVRTFTIGYEGDHASYRNELQYARRMAAQVGAEHHERLLNADELIDFLPTMVHLQDEPIADPVCFPVYCVSKLARENGVVVCQVGEGADELFCGYPLWKTTLALQRWSDWPVPAVLKRLGLSAMRLAGQDRSPRYEWLRRSADREPVFWSGAEAFTEGHKQRLLAPGFRRKIETRSSWEALRPVRERFDEAAWDRSDLNWMTYADLRLRLPELLLMRVDKMSMGASLEARVPFLDHKFVELAMSIPTQIKVGDGQLKYLLKKAIRGLVPDELIDRPKQGFGVPVHEWSFGRLGERTRAELDRFCRDTGYFDRREVFRLLDGGAGMQVWYLLNFALWWRAYVAR